MLIRLPEYLQKRSRSFIFLLSLLLTILIGLIDYISGAEISIILFYLIPIFMATWYGGNKIGLLMSLVGSVVWFLAWFLIANYSHQVIFYWNTIVISLTFIAFTYLLSALKGALDHEKTLSRTDALTGAMNRRQFYEFADSEMKRALRYKHPFTVAYIDLDNFKLINDNFGHIAGDNLLRTVTDTLRVNLRVTDVFARLSGDEFAIIFPETGNEASVRTFINKICDNLLEAMKKNGWPVTFSIGIVIYLKPPDSVDEMINIPDTIMYSVKHNGKNMMKLEVFGNL
ncbi:MAG: GGDEF domain-containing protein [Proteobacteria bacterium]|nr:GGDEF domain-containing protein [Pseudomonadota bacterium]